MGWMVRTPDWVAMVQAMRRRPRTGAAACAGRESSRGGSVAAVIAQFLSQGALRFDGEHLLDPPSEPGHRGVLDLPGSRDVDGEDAQDPPGPRLHERDAGPEDRRLANVVGHEDDGLAGARRGD